MKGNDLRLPDVSFYRCYFDDNLHIFVAPMAVQQGNLCPHRW